MTQNAWKHTGEIRHKYGICPGNLWIEAMVRLRDKKGTLRPFEVSICAAWANSLVIPGVTWTKDEKRSDPSRVYASDPVMAYDYLRKYGRIWDYGDDR